MLLFFSSKKYQIPVCIVLKNQNILIRLELSFFFNISNRKLKFCLINICQSLHVFKKSNEYHTKNIFTRFSVVLLFKLISLLFLYFSTEDFQPIFFLRV